MNNGERAKYINRYRGRRHNFTERHVFVVKLHMDILRSHEYLNLLTSGTYCFFTKQANKSAPFSSLTHSLKALSPNHHHQQPCVGFLPSSLTAAATRSPVPDRRSLLKTGCGCTKRMGSSTGDVPRLREPASFARTLSRILR